MGQTDITSMYWERHIHISAKMYNLNLIMRNNQENLNRKVFYKIIGLYY